MVESKYKPNYPKPEIEKAAIRKTILEINPDILALQEIGDASQLLELQKDLREAGLNLPYSAIVTEAPDKQRRIAILSKLAPSNLDLHKDIKYTQKGISYTSKRGMLGVEFITNGYRWKLFIVHLKSRFSEDENDLFCKKQRIGEAQALRNRIAKQSKPPTPYIVCGDFNDTPDSRSLKRFLQKGIKKLCSPIDCTDTSGLTWTHRNHNSETLSRYDYFLISENFKEQIKTLCGHIAPINEGSDHRLVYIDIEL
jgi:endonuclease/exonuclease/phosphatase family metal-dependent hydrolase